MVSRLYRQGLGSRIFDGAILVILTITSLLTLYPLIYVVVLSFSTANIPNPYLYLWPVKPQLENYQVVLQFPVFWRAYLNTVLYAVSGAGLCVLVTMLTAYALSIETLPFRRVLLFLIVFTMLFSGGLIPYYLQIRNLGLVNNPLVMILPGALSGFNVIIALTFLRTNIPRELREAARIDGAGDWAILWRIVFPLSKPIVAVLALFSGVAIWNSYFGALIFLNDRDLFPVALVLREIVVGVSMIESLPAEVKTQTSIAGVRTATLVLSVLPLLVIYPFLQKYFAKGVMLGALKG
ncbi:MAG: carbohydrate ABC transporter permease [Caldilinea sp. CFX5]|nr:carbohydrate ABC transporter permease [Caldilinea sp. CFX5]